MDIDSSTITPANESTPQTTPCHWAAIRLARYKLENIVIKGDLESLEGKEGTKAAAVGDEVGSAFDLDIGV